MNTKRARFLRLQVRVAIYVVVIAVLFLVRGGMDWNRLLSLVPGAAPDSTLSLAGADLAPDLVARIADHVHRDDPDLRIDVAGGGTAQALEALINRRSDVAFLCRPPTAAEQDLFRSTDGDTALWYPIALGGLVLLAGESAPDSLTTARLGDFLRRGADPGFDRLYAADPNLGLWDAFTRALGAPGAAPPERVIFLAGEEAVIEAVLADPRSLGLASSLSLPRYPARPEVRRVLIRSGAGRWFPPTYEAIGSGEYPLHHRLYVACLQGAAPPGSRFVTHVVSARGQRQIERAGFLPARRVSREVVLTRNAPGGPE